MSVPFFRPSISQREIQRVLTCLQSGWLTTGPHTKEFEVRFAEYVGAKHAIALNSCTAALHLALEALGVGRGDLVLVPTFTFAATAEVVRYFDAVPVFVDAEPESLCIDPQALRRTLRALTAAELIPGVREPGRVRAVIPVHYGGQMVDVDAIRSIATEYGLPIIEDAAHTLPAGYRAASDAPWRRVGTTADITCFSFYANKCITTGEGGMAVTDDDAWAARMRLMSLHGMSKDAWKRFMGGGAWFYEIVAPGFKYNMTDVAASLGLAQLEQAEEFLTLRRRVAERYIAAFGELVEIELPKEAPNRQHSWHLFPIRLVLDRLTLDRAAFIEQLNARGIGASVHWMPLHLQPYYRETYGYQPDDFPVAYAAWPRLVSLPIFPGMTDAEVDEVVAAVRSIVAGARG